MIAAPASCLMKEDFMPVVYYYYDRADMPATTPYETRHSHSLYEIMYVAEGAARLIADGDEVILRRGQYILLNANAKHALYVEPDAPLSMLNVEYQFERADGRCPSTRVLCEESPDFKAFLESRSAYVILSDSDGAAGLLLKQINRWSERGDEISARLCSYLMTQLMLIMACSDRRPDDVASASGNPYVLAALKRIENDYRSPLTARMLAQEMFICPNYLHQLFHKHTGLTIREHLRRRRIRQAKWLLQTTDIPVSGVAESVGIASAQYFTRMFTEYTGVSPLTFRQAATGLNVAEVRRSDSIFDNIDAFH